MTNRTQTSSSLFRRAVAAVTAAGVIGLAGASLMPATAEAAGVVTHQAAYAVVPAPVVPAAGDTSRSTD